MPCSASSSLGKLLLGVVLTAACTARPPAGRPALPPVESAPRPALAVLPGGYRLLPDARVTGYVETRFGDVTLLECAQACSLEAGFRCASFDYYERQRICALSPYTVGEVGRGERDDYGPSVVHYERVLAP